MACKLKKVTSEKQNYNLNGTEKVLDEQFDMNYIFTKIDKLNQNLQKWS